MKDALHLIFCQVYFTYIFNIYFLKDYNEIHLKGAILHNMKYKNIINLSLIFTLLTSCALITDEYQANQRKLLHIF